jgi:hypothetical protein
VGPHRAHESSQEKTLNENVVPICKVISTSS